VEWLKWNSACQLKIWPELKPQCQKKKKKKKKKNLSKNICFLPKAAEFVWYKRRQNKGKWMK
jgi:tRNA U34 2-thiouridine synthase MnmA/TrmU